MSLRAPSTCLVGFCCLALGASFRRCVTGDAESFVYAAVRNSGALVSSQQPGASSQHAVRARAPSLTVGHTAVSGKARAAGPSAADGGGRELSEIDAGSSAPSKEALPADAEVREVAAKAQKLVGEGFPTQQLARPASLLQRAATSAHVHRLLAATGFVLLQHGEEPSAPSHQHGAFTLCLAGVATVFGAVFFVMGMLLVRLEDVATRRDSPFGVRRVSAPSGIFSPETFCADRSMPEDGPLPPRLTCEAAPPSCFFSPKADDREHSKSTSRPECGSNEVGAAFDTNDESVPFLEKTDICDAIPEDRNESTQSH